MREFTSIFAVVLGLFVITSLSSTAQAQDFEGVIHYEVMGISQQQTNSMPYMIKGNKGRIEMNTNGKMQAAMLFFPEESRRVIIMEAMNGYMEMPQQKSDDSSNNQSKMKASLTGETKTIAGRECEVLRTETPNNVIEACMAKGMGSFMMPQDPMGKSEAPAWAKELFSQNAMPLEVVEIQNGNRTVQMKATKIEEKTLSDDLFTIPDGYRDMSGMMKKMQRGNQ